MKTLSLFFLACATFFACQHSEANPAPAVTKKYTDLQIDSLTNSHRSVKSIDVVPSGEQTKQLLVDFPGAADIDWEVGNNIYNVEFEIDWVDYEAWYDQNNNLLTYKYEIKPSKLPAVVVNAINQKYPKYRIDDADRFVKGSVSGYIVSVEKGKMEYKASFKDDGTLLSEVVD